MTYLENPLCLECETGHLRIQAVSASDNGRNGNHVTYECNHCGAAVEDFHEHERFIGLDKTKRGQASN